MRCACTCDVQLLIVRVVMCAFEAIAHICMHWLTCALYVLYCSVHISFHLVPLQIHLLETDVNIRLAELCTSAGEERLAPDSQL